MSHTTLNKVKGIMLVAVGIFTLTINQGRRVQLTAIIKTQQTKTEVILKE